MGSAGSPYRTADVVQPPPPPKRWYVRQFGPYGAFNVPVGIAVGVAIGTAARRIGIVDWRVYVVGLPLVLLFWWRRCETKPADGAFWHWIPATWSRQ